MASPTPSPHLWNFWEPLLCVPNWCFPQAINKQADRIVVLCFIMIVYICFFPQRRTPWNLRTLSGGWFQQAFLQLLQCYAARFQRAPFGPGARDVNPQGPRLPGRLWGWYFLGVGQHCYFEHMSQVHELLLSTLLQLFSQRVFRPPWGDGMGSKVATASGDKQGLRRGPLWGSNTLIWTGKFQWYLHRMYLVSLFPTDILSNITGNSEGKGFPIKGYT